MDFKKIWFYLFVSISMLWAANTDTLFVIKNNEVTQRLAINTDVDSLSFSKTKGNYQLDFFKSSAKVKSITVSEVDSIVFYNPFAGTFVDDRDGQKYRWVRIGDQVWMAQNIAWLPSVNPPSDLNFLQPRHYVYDYKGESVAAAKSSTGFKTYGVYYNWFAALDACPTGWRLPNDADWNALITFAGGAAVAGTKLRDVASWEVDTRFANTDDYGFRALPAGFIEFGEFIEQNKAAFWWSLDATHHTASATGTLYSTSDFIMTYLEKSLVSNVRCIKGPAPAQVPLAAIAKFEVNPDEIVKGFWAEYTVEFLPNNATNTAYVLTSSDESIVGIGDGYLNFYEYGSAIITLTTSDGNFTKTLEIVVPPPKQGVVIDERDGNSYKWVRIGDQVWTAENMKWLPQVHDKNTYSLTEPTYHVYEYNGNDVTEAKNSSNYNDYGVLYNFYSAPEACPAGWHLPTADEWEALIEYAGGEELASIKLKSMSGWGEDGDGTDIFGFAGLPGGYHYTNYFNAIGRLSVWWSSSGRVYDMRLATDFSFRNGEGFVGYPVRCVQGEVPVTGISFSDDKMTLTIGESGRVNVSLVPDNATNRELSWYSSDEAIATVDAHGVVTAVGIGVATVSAQSADGAFTADCEIKVKWGSAGVLVDSRDNESYTWVLLGELRWTSQNMRWLPESFAVDNTDDESTTAAKYYYYDNDFDNFEEYGVLYNKPAALLACAPGWRLPTQAEWEELSDNYDPAELKSIDGWNGSLGGNNLSGFNALPGGYKNDEASSVGIGSETRWWSSTGTSAFSLATALVHEDDGGIYGYSVRCVSE